MLRSKRSMSRKAKRRLPTSSGLLRATSSKIPMPTTETIFQSLLESKCTKAFGLLLFCYP
ncbi:hypothetical protein TorRG33x02_160380 [Trema orientale]|uniref:Uncharacterized protein n=1 Tax=Trema orientale TaxID=63057 RepID=A0A2P5ERM8_TREOI|nr:hypothetical protein TorRG33x02_160380 [Trema orientale]